MSATTDHTPAQAGPDTPRDLPQLGLAAAVVLIGAFTVYDATTLEVGFADPVGPRVFPYVVGGALVVLGALLGIAAWRGDVPQEEGGEDVDLTQRADWPTVGKLLGVLLFTILTLNVLGWAVNGAILFAGAAWALGSRTLVRDVLIGAVLAVGSWYAFYSGLGIPLGAGILDGVL